LDFMTEERREEGRRKKEGLGVRREDAAALDGNSTAVSLEPQIELIQLIFTEDQSV